MQIIRSEIIYLKLLLIIKIHKFVSADIQPFSVCYNL